jgi:hypothetical protein
MVNAISVWTGGVFVPTERSRGVGARVIDGEVKKKVCVFSSLSRVFLQGWSKNNYGKEKEGHGGT